MGVMETFCFIRCREYTLHVVEETPQGHSKICRSCKQQSDGPRTPDQLNPLIEERN